MKFHFKTHQINNVFENILKTIIAFELIMLHTFIRLKYQNVNRMKSTKYR